MVVVGFHRNEKVFQVGMRVGGVVVESIHPSILL